MNTLSRFYILTYTSSVLNGIASGTYGPSPQPPPPSDASWRLWPGTAGVVQKVNNAKAGVFYDAVHDAGTEMTAFANRNVLCRSVYDSAFSLIELVYLTVWFAFGADMSSQKVKVLIDIVSDTVWPWYVLYWCCLFHSAYEKQLHFMWWACFNPDPGEMSYIVHMHRWLYPFYS